MNIISEYETEFVQVRVVRLEAGDKMLLERSENKHTVSIPMSGFANGPSFEMLRGYLLHYTSPKDYCSLSPQDHANGEVFLQLIWKVK
jgi:hypothetical protein